MSAVQDEIFEEAQKIALEFGMTAVFAAQCRLPETDQPTPEQKQIAKLASRFTLRSAFAITAIGFAGLLPKSDLQERLLYRQSERVLQFCQDIHLGIDDIGTKMDTVLKSEEAAVYAEQKKMPLLAQLIRHTIA